MRIGDTVLNGRYTLVLRISRPEIETSEFWEATDVEGNYHTLKITPYIGEKPPSEIRRLWDNDLRVMYRLSSSAGAGEQLVVMTDAGIDTAAHAMVLVYEGCKYVTFAEMLKERDRKEYKDWLSVSNLKNHHIRKELWGALLQLARGLKSLHDQNLIHRNVIPEAVWGRQGAGPESLRLGGFDWSARIGHAANTTHRNPWATPPELVQVGYSFISDWYGFGTLIARCFYKVEHIQGDSPNEHAMALAFAITSENPCNLAPLEKDFIKEVTAPDRIDRLQNSADIMERIEKIIEALDFGRRGRSNDLRVLLQVNHKDPKLIDAARTVGFMVNPDDPFAVFEPESPEHQVLLKDFLTDQLKDASLSWETGRNKFELKCNSTLSIRGERWMDFGKEQSWKAAKAKSLNRTAGFSEFIPAKGFDCVRIEIEFSPSEVNKKIAGSGYTTWDLFAPKNDASQILGHDSENLRQFLHASNQFEILLRDAELFKYKVVDQAVEQDCTKITIAPVDEDRPSRKFFKADQKLADFLQQELDSAKPDCDKIFLTESDSLFVSRAGANSASERFDVDKEQWTISKIDRENETITLFRKNLVGIAQPSSEGYLRTRGHYGQIRLIERRKQSIDRLSSHAYLLRALASPGFTHIDAGDSELPWRQIEENGVIDKNKLATIKDILRVRPMYALQGPPGTGKSTLVAHLLRQILEDDPMAQILVTAKDHAAVDVLLNKVVRQAYQGVQEDQHPLAIRLNRRDGNDHARELVDKLVQTAIETIRNQMQETVTSAPQHSWYEQLKQLKASRAEDSPISDETQRVSNALLDLVRRGASITYSTTSSGDLEELAKGAHSFDWSIIEEAGKTHGFDLALPLQAGHRWLLLGDHKQLRPFMYEEFADCFNRLDDDDGVIPTLKRLRDTRGNARLIDIEWIKAKIDADPNWAKSFSNFARSWIASFATVFEQRSKLKGITSGESIGASAGLLTRQYRMPPVIGDLNSAVFYKGEVGNATANADGGPDEWHCNPIDEPACLAGKSLVWLDIGWAEANGETKRKGYSNSCEQRVIARLLEKAKVAADHQSSKPYTIAILTPYNMQRIEINKNGVMPPAGCQFGSAQSLDSGKYKAYSVDSFQGDEADIVVVSLVRNKLKTQGVPMASDIKFIAAPDRLNVMFSRAKRLLVVVGCWDYLAACMETVSSATDELGNYNDPDFGPFKKTLEELNAMFKDGRALKITAEEALQ